MPPAEMTDDELQVTVAAIRLLNVRRHELDCVAELARRYRIMRDTLRKLVDRPGEWPMPPPRS
jgi:hypothetical protein